MSLELKSNPLIINKADIAPMVGASLDVMERDSRMMRGDGPFVFTELLSGNGVDFIVNFIIRKGMLRAVAL